MAGTVPIEEAMAEGYRPCIDLGMLCRVYGCRREELSVLVGESQNLIYYRDWNIAYEQPGGNRCRSAYYGNPFYDFFGSFVTPVQWTTKERGWSQIAERGNFTPEETALLLNAFTEIMHWRETPGRAKELKELAKHAFDVPADAERFQKFLREREKRLVLAGEW